MRSVTVAVHRINGVNAPELDEAGLRSVFASAGITLTLVQGSPLPSDPAVRPNFEFRNLVPQFQQQGSPNGHLIIGNRHPSNDREIAGELADLATRGLCLVYAGSRYVRENGALGLLQTAAHEIGHMLNLGHGDITRDFDTAMEQAWSRGPTGAAWAAAIAEVPELQAGGQTPYWTTPVSLPNCHPFAHVARHRLNRAAIDEIRPWGEPYNRGYDGAHDRWYTSPGLRVMLEAERFVRDGVLAFLTVFENREGGLKAAPAELSPTFDTLIVEVARPSGMRYRHVPRGIACSTAIEPMQRGDVITYPFCTIRGPGAAALPETGVYELRVVAPALGIASLPVQFEVVESDGNPAPLPRDLARLSAPRLLSRKDRQSVKEAARRPDGDPLSRGYSALTALSFETDPTRIAGLERIALASSSPTEVRHAAAIARWKRLTASGRAGRGAARRMVSKYLTRRRDRHIAARILEETL